MESGFLFREWMSKKVEHLGSECGTVPCVWVSPEPGERLMPSSVISGVSSPMAISWVQHHSPPLRQFLIQRRVYLSQRMHLSVCQPWAGVQPHRERWKLARHGKPGQCGKQSSNIKMAQLSGKIRCQAASFFAVLNKFIPPTILKQFWLRTRKETSYTSSLTLFTCFVLFK